MSRKNLFFLFCFQISLAAGGSVFGSGVPGEPSKETDKNPFAGEAYQGRKVSRDDEWVLRGVLWSEHEPYALIGWRVVKVGDIVKNRQVTAINKDSVTLSAGKKVIELTLNGKNR